MTKAEQIVELLCHECGHPLTNPVEKEAGEWFLRCLNCGVENILSCRIEIVGCRREPPIEFVEKGAVL